MLTGKGKTKEKHPHLLQEIAEQIHLGVENSDAYLDPKTGTIYRYRDTENVRKNPARAEMHMLPTTLSQDTYNWMLEFTKTVPDPKVRKLLNKALDRIGALWHFRNVLYQNNNEQEQWDRFYNKKLLAVARDWLK